MRYLLPVRRACRPARPRPLSNRNPAVRLRLLAAAATLLVVGCDLRQEPTLTVVEGTVRNPYLAQPVPAVPLVVYRVFSTWSEPFIDSVTATQTDAASHYRLAFDATPAATYEVRLAHSLPLLFDIDRGLDGHPEAVRGTTTQVDFAVTPTKTVWLDVQTSKGGKTDLSFGYRAADNGPWFGGQLFSDTSRVRQQITFQQPVQVLPNRTYRFTQTTANRYRAPGKNYDEYTDYTYTSQERRVGYNDTTVIKFR